MKLILVRHGHYLGNNPIPQERLKEMTGPDWDEVHRHGLTQQGIEQAICAQEKLKDITIDYLYSSPIPRARETAEIIRGTRDLPILFLDELREIMPLTFPGAPEDYRCDEVVNYRQAKDLEAILRERHGDGNETVLAVTHGNFLATLFSSLLGLGPCCYNRFTGFPNCTVLEVILKNPDYAQLIWGR